MIHFDSSPRSQTIQMPAVTEPTLTVSVEDVPATVRIDHRDAAQPRQRFTVKSQVRAGIFLDDPHGGFGS